MTLTITRDLCAKSFGIDIAENSMMLVKAKGCGMNVANRSEISLSRRSVCILIAEDDNEMRAVLSSAFSRDGYVILEIADSQQLHAFLADRALPSEKQNRAVVDVIISDIRLPGKTALDVLVDFKRIFQSVPIVLITAFDDGQTINEALRIGATAVFDKPFDIHEFKAFLTNLVARSSPNAVSD